MSLPEPDRVRELVETRAPDGVISVYLPIDRGDRGLGWRVALRDGLRGILAEHDAEPGSALRRTAEQLMERWPESGRPPDGRGLVAFVEVAEDPEIDRTLSSQVRPRDAHVVLASRPFVRPLVEMLDDNRAIGVAVLSSEEARLMEWKQGELTELEALEILTTGDWRERKAQRPPDPASAQAPSSSGRDQHQQRLDANRERFVSEVAGKVAELVRDRGWEELIGFGPERFLGELDTAVAAVAGDRTVHHRDKNLISEPDAQIAERIEELVPAYNRQRELGLIKRSAEWAAAGGRGALGPEQVAEALAVSRVEHLVIAGDHDFDRDGLEQLFAVEGRDAGGDIAELFVERALATGARVTPVEDEAAEKLAAHGGAAALLRY